MPKQFLEPHEVAAQLRLKVETLYQWKYRGIGPRGFRVGNRLRYLQSDVDAYIESQRSA